MKTPVEYLREKGILSDDKTTFEITFSDKSTVTVNNLLEEYADQFKPKWNTFTSDRSTDPKFGEYVLIVSQYKPDKPKLIQWDNIYGVIEGDQWIYFKDLRNEQN